MALKKLAGTLIFVTYLILATLVWGITTINSRTKTQLQEVERVLERNERNLREIEEIQRLVADCSTPGGRCFEEQLESEGVINALDIIVDRLGCVLLVRPEARTPATIERCKETP